MEVSEGWRTEVEPDIELKISGKTVEGMTTRKSESRPALT